MAEAQFRRGDEMTLPRTAADAIFLRDCCREQIAAKIEGCRVSFDEFLKQVEDPALRAVAQHWNAVRDGKLLPGWKDIDPAAIARHLPIIWSWQYDRNTDSFIGRLSGEEINRAFGKSLRGVAMKDFFEGWDYEKIFQRHRRVVTEPCFAHGKGAVFIHAQRYGEGERIILPLAEDGETGDGIIGATVYRLLQPIDPTSVPGEGEHVDFYPIGDLPPRRPV